MLGEVVAYEEEFDEPGQDALDDDDSEANSAEYGGSERGRDTCQSCRTAIMSVFFDSVSQGGPGLTRGMLELEGEDKVVEEVKSERFVRVVLRILYPTRHVFSSHATYD